MGTIYTDNTVAELERRCHREGSVSLSPTAMSALSVKIVYLIEALDDLSYDEQVELLIKEFELSRGDDQLEMCVEVRKFDSYGEFMGGEKTLMLRNGAELNFEQIVSGKFKPEVHTRIDWASGGPRRGVELRDTTGKDYSYNFELRYATDEDFEDA